MVALTPEQFEHFIRVMILVALLGGFVGAVIWDLIQASGLGMVSGIGYLVDRHKRIKAARSRATAQSAPVEQSQLICQSKWGQWPEHLWDADVRGDEVTHGSCARCGQDVYP